MKKCVGNSQIFQKKIKKQQSTNVGNKALKMHDKAKQI